MKKQIRLVIFFSLFTFHFSFLYAQNGSWLWASHGNNGWITTGRGQDMVSADNSGNCFYTGVLIDDTIKFGSYTLLNSSTLYYDIFLAKFDQNGNVLWAKQSTQNGNQANANGYVVSTDAIGNAYIMANFMDKISFESYILTSQGTGFQDNFLVKYDPSGNVVWARQSQIPSYYSGGVGNSLATDKNGNSYVNGVFFDTVSFGGKSLIGIINGAIYNFLVKYDNNGNVKWAKQSVGHSHSGSRGQGVAVNIMNDVFVAGDFYDSVTFDSFKLRCPSTLDGNVFIVKYDSNGNVKWAKQGIIPSSRNFADQRGIAADNFGNVYVSGLYWDTLIFGNDTLVTIKDNIFLVKYDSNGNMKWAIAPHVLDNNTWGPTALSSDKRGEIFMSGQGGGPGLCKICFGNDTLSANDTSNIDIPSFVVKFDSSGKVLCASINICGGNGNEWNGITSDTSGNFVYFGATAETIGVFGSDTIYPYENVGAVPFVARWKECDATLGINNIITNTNKAEVKVYPNPSNGTFTLSLSNVNATCNVEIYNILGEKVFTETLPQNQSNNTISLISQPSGVYFYRVIEESGNLVGNGKLVIEK